MNSPNLLGAVSRTGSLAASLVLAIASAPLLLAQGNAKGAEAEHEFFEKKVRPILATKCQMCHNAKMKSSGLDMSTGEAFFKGGASGSLVNVESPEKSFLIQAISYETSLKMPPTGKLPDEQIATLKEWIGRGAKWPGVEMKVGAASAPTESASNTGTRKQGRMPTPEELQFWAFLPPKTPSVPALPANDKAARAWAKTPIDAFLMAKMLEKKVAPAAPASRTALLRRVTLDLTGLPPTADEIQAFLADKSPQAYAKVVDRLLASPRYGERWGRHWLDVARYADSTGNDEDHRYPYAYRYRDYVIDSFNQDIPYNVFVKEQIAGDLLPPPPGQSFHKRGIVATGFLALGAKAVAQQDKTKMLYDVYDEQVDVVTKGFLGITLACARCHDHKFDPLYASDYYGMINIFASTRNFKNPDLHVSTLLFTPLTDKATYEKYEAAQAVVDNKKVDIDIRLDAARKALQDADAARFADYLAAARQMDRQGATPKDLAAKTGLSERQLQRWKEFLAAKEVPRPYLEAWEKATDAEAVVIAQQLQKKNLELLADWQKRMTNYRKRQREQIAEKNMLNEKPNIAEHKDEFFRDLYVDNGPFGMNDKTVEQVSPETTKQELAALQADMKKLKEAMPPEPEMACAVQEGKPVEQKIFLRGDYNNLGAPAPKSVPLIMTAERTEQARQLQVPAGSGRLQLAEWIASPNNPLTARVMVNRVWQWHFGEGIVRTPDNFGRMGERPSHPELLDYLATQFVQSGWSLKKLHRQILLSNAYQMSSFVTPAQAQTDPDNRLFSRFPRRRMEVEELRDSLLSISGRLDLTMGGTMQSGFGTDGENSSGRLSINPETQTRRSVYLPLRRANLPALLNLFDFGDATTANGKRVVTNVAPQALFLLNSQFVAEQAQSVAKELLAKTPTPQQRANAAMLRILNRPAEAAEADNLLTYLESFKARNAGKKNLEEEAWQSLCRVLIASNEFLYVD